MAENQPAQAPAVDPVAPQNPGQQPDASTAGAQQPASQTPNEPSVTLTDDQKNYLKGQGLTDEDLSSSDALTKIIAHAQSSQKTLAQTKAELDKVKEVVAPQPAEPTNPLVQPAESQQPQDGQPAQSQPKTLDSVTALTLATSLATAYPQLKDEFTSGEIYTQMQNMGIPMHTPSGDINLTGIQQFAQFASKQKEMEAAPNPDTIPDANPTTPQQPDANFEMDKQKALAILAQDPNHPRAEEAKQFLQKSV